MRGEWHFDLVRLYFGKRRVRDKERERVNGMQKGQEELGWP